MESDPVGLFGGSYSPYAYANGNPVSLRDPTGKDPFLGLVGALVGGGWGLANGLVAGDSGAQLWVDAGAGAATGGLIGLTDGLSLLSLSQGAVIAAGMEANRQVLNGAIASERAGQGLTGCIQINRAQIGVAAAGSVFGDLMGAEVQLARSGQLLDRGLYSSWTEFNALGAWWSLNVSGALGLGITGLTRH